MAKKTIRQRIALDGGEQIKKELAEFGEAGEKAFRDLQAAANNLNLDKSVVASLARMQKQFAATAQSFKAIGQEIRNVGQSLSTYVTLPIVGLGTTMLKVAGDFESSMNAFVANTGAAGAAFDEAKAKAIDLGNASIFSATEAANAMTELAKVGLSYEQIMEGAADATVKLAAANGAELAPAAAAVGDIINQFGLEAKDLDGIINSVSGTLIQSKLDFDGYRLAIGQAGGVAGALGVNFKEFNAVLASTASSFASGSDAGTSFKTFLTRLVPQTDKAAAIFQEMNLQFFNADGSMRSMAEIAEELRVKMSALSDRDLNLKVKELFGVDAMRTAIGLMRQGGDGVEAMMAKLEKTDAAALAETRVRGLNGALDQLKSAFDDLSIAIGDSGLLEFVTELTIKLTEFLRDLAKTNPEMLKWGTIIAGVAAAIGPFLVALGLATIGIGGLISGFGRILGVVSLVIAAFGRLRLAFLSNPVTAALTVVAGGIALWATRTDEATKALEQHRGVVATLEEAYRKVGGEVANITQEVRDRLRFCETRASMEDTAKALVDEIQKVKDQIAQFDGLLPKEADPIFDIGRQFQDDLISIEKFQAAIDALAVNNPALGKLANQFAGITAKARELSEGQRADTDWIDLLTGKIKDAEFQARKTGEAFAEIKPDAIKNLGDAADTTKGKVEALQGAITVTRHGSGEPTKQAFDLVDGIARAAATSKAELDAVGEAAAATGEKVAQVKESVFGVVRSVPQELRSQESPADALTDGLSGVPAAASTAVDGLVNEIARVGPAVAEAGGEGIVAALVSPFEQARDLIGGVWAQIGAFAVSGVNAILAEVGRLTASINQMIANIIASLQRAAAAAASLRAQAASGRDESGGPGFARGGSVFGAGTSTSNSIPAWLSNGEFVVNAKAVRRYGVAFMRALNSMRLGANSIPRLRDGGMASFSMPKLSMGEFMDGMDRSMRMMMPRPMALAGGGLAAAGGASMPSKSFDLHIGGEFLGPVFTSDDVAEGLVRHASQKSIRSTGRKPGWRGGR